ncbi:MAG: PIG-L family deacetylase [Rhodobacteraceae bacterium]|nr:PIG-L family deacetylase [Paracoccaceae bacterium]
MSISDQKKLKDAMQNSETAPLWQALQSLRSVVSFMNTGAHPDDETTRMLAALSLHDGVKISQACANRGEGGQNTIGTEAGAALGSVRTLEMERAAAVIDMTHYWLAQSPEDSISDFGFSKSGDETLEKWGEGRTLARFVEIIRTERPDIICPTFLDISGQHGHHQAMTRSAFKAVELAASPSYAPELGQVWQVKKLYLPAWSGAGDAYDDDVPPPPKTVMVDASGADPVFGADYAQIAEYSRSFHQTQGMGSWVKSGQPNLWPLNLAWHYQGKTGAEDSIFDGLPKTLLKLAEYAKAPQLAALLLHGHNAIESTLSAWPDTAEIRIHASDAHQALTAALPLCPPQSRGEIIHRLHAKIAQLSRVLWRARMAHPKMALTPQTIFPGDKLTLKTNQFPADITVKPVLPAGWHSTETAKGIFEILVPNTATPSDPYPDIWRPEAANGPLHLALSWSENGTPISMTLDFAQKPMVQPAVSAKISQHAAIINLQAPAPLTISVSDIHPEGAQPSFLPKNGWDISQSGSAFTLTPNQSIQPGNYRFPLLLNGEPAQMCQSISYPHIGATQLINQAEVSVQVVDISLPKGRFAYIGGGNDTAGHWLKKLGLNIESLRAEDMPSVDFAAYDSILIGVFALRTNAALAARLPELHQWVHNGGNLVTLYHRPWDNWDINTTPLAPLTIGKPSLRWRVTDENAEVKHLQPAHPLLNTPNPITPADWLGWFKERGLYFASSWDPAYVPLLSMADNGEAPLEGGLLSGNFGKGRHTHTSLTLHLQAQNMVPGGLKLLVNLLNPVPDST